MQGREILDLIVEAIVEGNKDQTLALINKALQSGLNIKEILEAGLVRGAEEVGTLYEKSEIYLPELILSGAAMTAAIEILKPHLKKTSDMAHMGTILIGTPEGDIHSIGKNIISMLLQGQGYDVVDLGTDVPPMKFIEKAKEINPDVIGLSGLMTPTIMKMHETIALLHEENIKSKVIVGGGILSEESCRMMGADEFATDGWNGIKKIKKLIESKKERSA